MQKKSSKFEIVFIDFDGVIKASNNVKELLFVELFQQYQNEYLLEKIRAHHKINGGLSRFIKIPLYLQWAENCKLIDQVEVEKLIKKFNLLVVDRVKNSAWVPGALNFLKNPPAKYLILVTATPQGEISKILNDLGIFNLFDSIFGYPILKQDAVKRALDTLGCNFENCIYIGDSNEDLMAAKKNNIKFVLMMHKDNLRLVGQSDMAIENFSEYEKI